MSLGVVEKCFQGGGAGARAGARTMIISPRPPHISVSFVYGGFSFCPHMLVSYFHFTLIFFSFSIFPVNF